jgi:uncharacterized protein (TIGR03435 family)
MLPAIAFNPKRSPQILLALALAFFFVAGSSSPQSIASEIAAAQSDTVSGQLRHFDVATIRPVDPKDAGMGMSLQVYPGGRLTIKQATLKTLIGIAFQLSPWQISNANGWMDRDKFDLEAKPPESLASKFSQNRSLYRIEDEQLRQMLQALLIERFQLKFHRETKNGPVYALETSGKTLHMRQRNTEEEDGGAGNVVFYVGEGWAFFNTSMTQLARYASDKIVDRPVLDHTGLTGSFDFGPNNPGTDQDIQDGGYQALFFAFLADAGLKLKPATGQVELFLIESAAQPSQD